MKTTLTAILMLLGAVVAPSVPALDFAPVTPSLRVIGPSATPQFTFRVPVRLNAILPGSRAFIQCRPTQGSRVRAELFQEIPLDANGNFNGTVVLAGSLPPGEGPSLVDGYSCMLRMQCAGMTTSQTPCFGEACPDCWQIRPGTLFRPGAEGRMPR